MDFPAGFVLVLLVWGVALAVYLWLCGRVGMYWKKSRGRSYGSGYAVSLAFTPVVGWLFGMLLQANPEKLSAQQVEAGAMKKCPYCAEPIRAEAKLCRYCQKEQPPAV